MNDDLRREFEQNGFTFKKDKENIKDIYIRDTLEGWKQKDLVRADYTCPRVCSYLWKKIKHGMSLIYNIWKTNLSRFKRLEFMDLLHWKFSCWTEHMIFSLTG
jgi:hypothetical protein